MRHDWLQTHFNSIIAKCEVKCKMKETLWRIPLCRIPLYSGEFDLHDHHKARFELCSWSGKSIHANTTETTFGCSEVHTEVHKTYFVVWNFFGN